MALFDVLRSRKREENIPQRLPKGALKQFERPVRKQEKTGIAAPTTEKKKKNLKKEIKSKKTESASSQPITAKSSLAAELLLGPHITEQTSDFANRNIYTFRVSAKANKILIKKAIQEMYGFKPIKVRIINAKSKQRFVRGKWGTKPGFKKALVYLKEGDKIEFI